jgi:hypothetical protein
LSVFLNLVGISYGITIEALRLSGKGRYPKGLLNNHLHGLFLVLPEVFLVGIAIAKGF